MKIAIVGAGWAGLAAAVYAVQDGHEVHIWESARTLGGRARALTVQMPDGRLAVVDNGQHIMIGAYSASLELMRQLGQDPGQLLLRLPLVLRFADGGGIRFPDWPAPLDALAGILAAAGWSLADKIALARLALQWRLNGFDCAADLTVAQLCHAATPRMMCELIEPLCVSALNTPAHAASAQVFLRVQRDAVFGARGGSNLLFPRVDLGTLLPDAAARWLRSRGATVHLGRRIRQLARPAALWSVDGELFDQVILATTAPDAVHLLQASVAGMSNGTAPAMQAWIDTTEALQHAAITTVYAWSQTARLTLPMLALRSGTIDGAVMPAQFVFDRGQLGGPPGLLAFVISDSQGERDALQLQVLAQARRQLGIDLQAVQTVVEKRATLACTPQLRRPPMTIAPGLLACGDYVQGPYPSTIEGAVRSALAVIRSPDSAS